MSIYQRNLQIKKSWLVLDDLIDKYVQYLCQRKCSVPYVQDGVQKVPPPLPALNMRETINNSLLNSQYLFKIIFRSARFLAT